MTCQGGINIDWSVEIHGRDLKRLAVLDKAYNIGYMIEMNKPGTAEFTLKIDDEKNRYCKTFNYVKIYENGEYVDIFRIMPSELAKDAATSEITYYCEHVLGKLLDISLFKYHEIGGLGTYTPDVLNYILSRQADWTLGKCDFSRQFQYSWENENLLNALFSAPNLFDEEYAFTWDTTVYPWILNLVRPSNKVKAYLRYERNMKGIRKREGGSVVCTRLYALGYGEGVNQLGIEDVNPSGLPYIEADTVSEFGAVEKIWTDLRYQIAENLYSAAKAKLEKIKHPKVTYEIDALELWALTNIPIDKFGCGDVVKVIDEETGVDITTRIIRKSKSGIEKDYISATVVISTDSSDGTSDLYERSRINETYAQGATNINNYNYYGNCDQKYPAKIRFKIPAEAVNINKIELSFQADAFRAFSKAIKGGGGATISQSNTSTTQAGGATTSGPSSSTTTQDGGAVTSGPSSSTTTQDGGVVTSGSSSKTTTETDDMFAAYHVGLGFGIPFDMMQPAGDPPHGHAQHPHNHPHSHNMEHAHSIGSHSHGMLHTHNIGSHTHQMPHTHQIGGHTHDMTHTHRIDDHTHEIEYGIFEGPTASGFKVTVDGAETALATTMDEFDIVKYLSKDGGGKIVRGWHEVLIYPDNLCMINADVMVQIFVNSRGGGNY